MSCRPVLISALTVSLALAGSARAEGPEPAKPAAEAAAPSTGPERPAVTDSRASSIVAPRSGPRGSKRSLPNRFRTVVVGTVQADGSIRTHCVPASPDGSAEAAGGAVDEKR